MLPSLSTLLLSVGLVLSAGNQPPAAGDVLVAQEESPAKDRPGRPPVPNLKGLRQIKRPGGGRPARGGSRFKPVKPSIRPRHTRTPRKLVRPDKERGEAREEPDSGRSRKLRTAQPEPDEASFGPDGEIRVEKEKRCRPLPPRIKVLMNFNEAEVLEIVQWISEQTCKNFIVGDNIRGGKLTILSKTPVSADEAYRAFLSALNVNNMTVVKVGNFYKIQMKRDAAKDTIPTFVGEEENIPALDLMVTRVVQLKYVDANTINGTVKQLCSKDGDSHPYAPTNTLIISDTGSNMHRLMEIIEQLDTPLGQEEIRVVQVNFALATELAQTIEEIFGDKGGRTGRTVAKSRRIQPVRPRGKGTTPPGAAETPEGEVTVQLSKVIADERTNKLILVAASRSFPKVIELINKLDVPVPGEGQIQVVYLQHADAEELSATLTSLAQGTTGASRRASSRGRSKSAAGTQTAAELFQGEVKITADAATNSLVIVASQNDFKSLNKVIKKLDIRRRQVFVEAVIMEVNVDTTKDVGMAFHGGAGLDIAGETVPLFFGTQYKAQGSTSLSSLNMLSAVQMLGFVSGLSGPELSADKTIVSGISLPSFGVILQALQTDSNVNVLSTPHILTSDNEEAEIKVGENIPIPAGYGGYGGGLGSLAGLASMASRTTGTTATSTMGRTGYGGYGGYGGLGGLLGMGMGAINRQEVGLTLKIKPQINEGNVIRMELEEELSEVKDTSNPLGPTTTQRSAKTVVEVQDQQTVVVGGLMRDKIDIGETKVPVLGDIPVIGWFFRSRRQQKTKTNLLLFLTPYVVEGPQDFRDIFERKMRERREFLERFYGAGPKYKTYIDFRRKHGPLADIHLSLRAELDKIENGGPGSGREILITPVGEVETREQGPGATVPGGAAPSDSQPGGQEAVEKEDEGIVEETLVPEGGQPAQEAGEHRLEVE